MTGGDFIMNGRDLHDKILSNSGQILDCEGSMSPFNFDEQLPNNVINVSNVFALSIWYITCPFYLYSV